MQNIRIGITTAMVPVGVKSRAPAGWPSWKIHTIAPNVAVRLSMFRTTALIGTSRLPNSRNNTTKVTTAMNAAAYGTREKRLALESTSSAGAATSRTSWTICSPSDDIGSTAGTTDSHVASADENLADAGPAGAT